MRHSIIEISKKSLAFVLCLLAGSLEAQTTKVSGTVTDNKSKEKLSFVSIVFPGKKPVVTVTDSEGRFVIEGNAETETLVATLVGYEPVTVAIIRGLSQAINISLKYTSETLNAAVATAKRPKYSNRNNPAVDLVRKMIANKSDNRIEAREYYKYEKYEKLELGLNDFLSDSASNKTAYRRLRVVFNYLDSSEITGKQVLPVFFKESATSVYYRKSPESRKEHVNASRMVDLREIIDMESVENYLSDIFGNVNVYDNEIMLFDNKYMGPLSPFAPHYYRFHIIDTVAMDDGTNCIRLSFFPRNDGDLGFRGDLYVTADSA